MANLTALQQRLGHTFNDLSLLERALTHRSHSGDNNERLEFLGDAVLSLVITTELFQQHPDSQEGKLSRLRSTLVNGELLAQLAVDLEVGDYLRLGVGEQRSGGQHRRSILADAFEAIIGAIYCDAGIDVVRSCVLHWFGERFADLSAVKPIKDPKSRLQEYLQARKLPLPEYIAEVSGEAHAQTFHVRCCVEGLDIETLGESSNRRKAEQLAAQRFLEILNV